MQINAQDVIARLATEHATAQVALLQRAVIAELSLAAAEKRIAELEAPAADAA